MCGVAQMRPFERASDAVRSITVLFCDIADSTVLANRLNPEAWSAMLAAYFEAVRHVAEEAGGRVEKFIGDAVVIVFGVDTGHEDDAIAAVRAGLAIRDQVSQTAGEHFRL
ncbi:MAG: adenylate/guanylate cyclase domain-containing protein, partial [Streptosporangiaceae bacterium]